MKLRELRENPNNPSKCTEEQLDRLAQKLKRVPLGLTAMRIAYVTDDAGGGKMVISGNKRLRVLKRAYGEDGELPDEYFQDVTAMSEAERHEFIVTANVSDGDWDLDKLLEQYGKEELNDYVGQDYVDELLSSMNVDDNTNNGDWKEKYSKTSGSLWDRFGVPPFSVLHAYKGEWLNRKRNWKTIIPVCGNTRKGTLASSPVGNINTVSLFDPALAEILSLWFCVDGGSIFDCFAGDTLKGLVFAIKGHSFTGIELRKEQVDENNSVIELAKDNIPQNVSIKYICDDGQNVGKHFKEKSQDMLFSCPPYYDLEVYSDMDNDASNQDTYEDFIKILRNAFSDAIKCLKDDTFAVIVVGDVRDKDGFYYDFPGDIKRIFIDNGMKLYNDIVLCDPTGTAGLKANLCMSSRKVVKVHQNVLVFYKGNPSNIKTKYSSIDYSEDDIANMIENTFGDNKNDE